MIVGSTLTPDVAGSHSLLDLKEFLLQSRDSLTGYSGQTLFYQLPIFSCPVAEQLEGRSAVDNKG